MFFLIGALRAILEMILLCLLAQGILYVLAGAGRERNVIYRLFAVVTAPPRCLVKMLVPARLPEGAVAGLTFILLAALWMALAWMRKFI